MSFLIRFFDDGGDNNDQSYPTDDAKNGVHGEHFSGDTAAGNLGTIGDRVLVYALVVDFDAWHDS